MNGLLSRCEKRDRLKPHVCCTTGSLGYWHALHRAIHIRIRCCSERSRSFLCSLMLDCKTRRMTVPSDRKALIWICCQRMMYGSRYLEHEFKSQHDACKCTTSSRVRVTLNRASYKMLQRAGREKIWPNRLSVYSLHSRLFIQTEKTV